VIITVVTRCSQFTFALVRVGPLQEMEYTQKESLLAEINELEEHAVNGVIEIIKVAESIVDDAEIDLGELQSSTMWKVRPSSFSHRGDTGLVSPCCVLGRRSCGSLSTS
jgi:hypothetical protein